VNAFTREQLTSLLTEWQSRNLLPVTPADLPAYIQLVFELTWGLPREVAILCFQYATFFSDPIQRANYLRESRRHYHARMEQVLQTDASAVALTSRSVFFAAELFTGRTLHDVPSRWQHAGLMAQRKREWYLPCPAALHAFESVFSVRQVLVKAIEMWLCDPATKWHALQLAVMLRPSTHRCKP